jgi:hypothetical protein
MAMTKRVDRLEAYWFANYPELSEPGGEEVLARLRKSSYYAMARFQDALEDAFMLVFGRHIERLLLWLTRKVEKHG